MARLGWYARRPRSATVSGRRYVMPRWSIQESSHQRHTLRIDAANWKHATIWTATSKMVEFIEAVTAGFIGIGLIIFWYTQTEPAAGPEESKEAKNGKAKKKKKKNKNKANPEKTGESPTETVAETPENRPTKAPQSKRHDKTGTKNTDAGKKDAPQLDQKKSAELEQEKARKQVKKEDRNLPPEDEDKPVVRVLKTKAVEPPTPVTAVEAEPGWTAVTERVRGPPREKSVQEIYHTNPAALTKKQKQNQRKAEAAREQKELMEKERLAALEKHRRSKASAMPYKPAAAPLKSAWAAAQSHAPSAPATAPIAPTPQWPAPKPTPAPANEEESFW
eukprot:Clim_evm50s199 gene=Clim_evmTU50s199